MRLVAAGSTPTEAEQLAKKAAEGVRVTLQQSYGTTVTILGPARSYAASAVRTSFRLRFRNADQGPFPTAGPVCFQRPGISINPGDGWMRHYMLGLDSGCDPQLIGQRKFNGDFLQPVLLGPLSTNVESGIAELRPSIAQQPGFIQSSCKEEPFASDSGLHGLHASFARKYPVPNPRGAGMILLTPTTHYYLVTNAHSRCAGIVYITVTGKESEQVQRMIRRTLRLEP
jgi:hypothetical protein